MMKRRDFLKMVAGSIVVAALAPGWMRDLGREAVAAEAKNLTGEELLCLEAIAATLMPTENKAIQDAVLRAADGLDKAAGSSPEALATYRDGIRDLNERARKATGKDFAELPLDERAELLKSIEGGALFGAASKTIWVVFNDRAVWKEIGYPGPSTESGGYVDKGFDVLAW